MSLFRFLRNLVTVFVLGFAGNWLGEQLLRLSTGEPSQQIQLLQTGLDGEIVIEVNPLVTNLVPGVLVGMAIRPRWLMAFMGV